MAEKNILLSIRDLKVSFFTEEGEVRAVNGVSYDTYPGKTLAVVGESGCGKSVTALSIMRLLSEPPARIIDGEILFRSQNLLTFSKKRMRTIRGNEIAMIFQEPMTSLNPVYTVGQQVVETIKLHHEDKQGSLAWSHAEEMLRLVGIADPELRLHDYPHQLSGGMRQRIMIAMALSCNPAVLIADEPTTALDVTIQAQILDLIRQLQRRSKMSVILITHDLGVVAENADDVVVMYASKVMEKADVHTLFDKPLHPYTQGLLRSLPRLGTKRDRLEVIPGIVPDPLHFPDGCKFHPRCPYCRDNDDKKCRSVEPLLEKVTRDHSVACWKWRQIAEETSCDR
ncbi:MAG: ABC transporter ATP-binding protein [Phycisphaerae bacterium]|nr:ABC transporter ATP-binding protein [Phycisphaerae bacterium]